MPICIKKIDFENKLEIQRKTDSTHIFSIERNLFLIILPTTLHICSLSILYLKEMTQFEEFDAELMKGEKQNNVPNVASSVCFCSRVFASE